MKDEEAARYVRTHTKSVFLALWVVILMIERHIIYSLCEEFDFLKYVGRKKHLRWKTVIPLGPL